MLVFSLVRIEGKAMHALTYFHGGQIVKEAKEALSAMEAGQVSGSGKSLEDAVKILLENQIQLAEALERVKREFDQREKEG